MNMTGELLTGASSLAAYPGTMKALNPARSFIKHSLTYRISE
jgi:hypothetical protein